ncbi:MAG: hypothetical protein V1923_02515 [Candidatus Omnitrophota bacterium]
MSIIHDALKKTGGILQPPQENPPEAPSSEVAAYLKKKRKIRKIEWVIFFLLAAILGLFIGNIPFDLGGKVNNLVKDFGFSWPALSKLAKPPGLQKKDTSLLKNIPFLPAEKKESDALVLNGIFSSQVQAYALINNRICKVGDVVNGATVRYISDDEVTLEDRGRLFKLTTK